MERRSSFLNDKTVGSPENRMTARLLSPLITAVIVLILGLIGLILT